ncbi:MAG TPA: hypothetical protein VIY29_08190, partial [Ktedonobacteraceae bacterium]
MKYIKITWHEISVIAIITAALALRMFLSSQNWPISNSDEATIGLMAMHIQRGELPIFYYGQNYMGALEAYLGAGLFSVFGVSLFTLRLVTTLLFLLFL